VYALRTRALSAICTFRSTSPVTRLPAARSRPAPRTTWRPSSPRYMPPRDDKRCRAMLDTGDAVDPLTWWPMATRRGFGADRLIHPAGHAVSQDAVAARYSGEFMVGDELLVAPRAGHARNRPRLPAPGIWTEICGPTQVYQGRQESPCLPCPSRCHLHAKRDHPSAGWGGARRALELHYFPNWARSSSFSRRTSPTSPVGMPPRPGEFLRPRVRVSKGAHL